MTELLSYAIRGIPVGCVFAVMAIGIVLTYKSSGVLNLAFAAQAYASAAIFFMLRDADHRNWEMLPALIVALVVAGPLLGWVLDRALYRHLRTAAPLTKLVTSLGLLVAIPQILKLDIPALVERDLLPGSGSKLRPPSIASEQIVNVGQFTLYHYEIATILITIAMVGGLTVLFKYTSIGLQMRAVVESPRMTELNGINAARVGSLSWMLSSLFAATAGVLIAPLYGQVSDLNFFTLLIATLAAAAFGRLTSIPLTLAGGLLLGVAQAVLAGELPADNVLSTGLRPALPFFVLFLLLLFWPGLRQRKETTDPLSGVDPPPSAPIGAIRSRGLTISTWVFAAAFIVGSTLISLFVLNEYWLTLVIKGVVLGLIFLSFTVITGMGGQISLCQASFAAVGAFATGQLVQPDRGGMSVLLAMFIGAAIAAVVGAVVALPALRLGGIYLALATLAFALMFENVIKPLQWVSNGTKPLKVPRPLLAGVDFASNKNFLLLSIALLAIFGVLVLLVRGGTTGRFLDALRGSETAATSIGINPAKAKIIAFALSAFIAGFGGGLLSSFERGVNYETNFNYYFGLVWVVLVVSLGARSVQAAVNAGVSFVLFPPLVNQLMQWQSFVVIENPQTLSQSIAFILFGFGAITYAKHPEGIIEAQTRKSIERMNRIGQRRRGLADLHDPSLPPTAPAGATAGGQP
jgi:branched-chain amino acid transport system permease protein